MDWSWFCLYNNNAAQNGLPVRRRRRQGRIQPIAIWLKCPGGPGSESISWRRLNVSARCSALWLDSSKASPVKSSNVTKSTE